jgi:UPF0176 protein
MRILFVGGNEGGADPGEMREGEQLADQSTPDASSLPVRPHGEVVEEELGSAIACHRQDVSRDSTDDVVVFGRNQRPKLFAPKKIGDVLVAERLAFRVARLGFVLLEHGLHRPERLAREPLVARNEPTNLCHDHTIRVLGRSGRAAFVPKATEIGYTRRVSAPVSNVAAYLFVPLEDLEGLRSRIFARARAAELRGTVLLAPEGINLFLAGPDVSLRAFFGSLRDEGPFEALTGKWSVSESMPFRRLLVKVKREIIRMDHPSIVPSNGRATAVLPRTLAQWLDQGHDDQGRPIALVDTRNAFEVGFGTFEGAEHFDLKKFTEFPGAIANARSRFEGKTIVAFCTGGIRCEKAALYMQAIGIPNVLQLEGGILRYFEDTTPRGSNAPHYVGTCFVFDEREALTSDLEPNPSPRT